MRKSSVVVGICLMAAFMFTVYAQSRDMDTVMKELGPAFQSLRKNLDGKMGADATKDAMKMEGLFKETEAAFTKMKIQDGTGWSKDGMAAVAEVTKALKANDMDAAAKASGAIGKSCKSCHDVHREQLPDKSYKMKGR